MRILGLPAPLVLQAAMALPLLSQTARWEEAIPRDRLLSEQVLALAVDTDNVTWVGTPKGVTRWQNAHSTHFTTWDALPASEIRDIAVDRQNVKWFATRSGVASFDDREWRTLDTALGLVSNDVTSIAVDFENVKWFGTKGGLSRFDGSTWTSFTLQSGDLPSNSVNQVAVGPDGDVWVATDAGVAHYDGADWQVYSRLDGIPRDSVTAIAVDQHGLVWCGTTAPGLSVFNGTYWYGFVEEGRVPLGENPRPRFPGVVTAVFVDPANDLWLATGNHLFAFVIDDAGVLHYNREEYGPAQRLTSFAVDGEGSILVGLDGGGVFRSRFRVDEPSVSDRFESGELWFWSIPGQPDYIKSRRVLLDDIRPTSSDGMILKGMADGGTLLSIGGRLLVRTDIGGDTLWTRTLEDESVAGIEEAPGDCCTVLADASGSGPGPSWKLYRFGHGGELLWERGLQVPPLMEKATSWRPFSTGLVSLGKESHLVAVSAKEGSECCSWWEDWQVIVSVFDSSGSLVSDAVVGGTPYWSNPRNRNSILGRGLLPGLGSGVVLFGREHLGTIVGHDYLEDREAPFVKAVGTDGSDIWHYQSPLTELSPGLGPSAEAIRTTSGQYLFMGNAGFHRREVSEYNRLLLAMLDVRGDVIWQRILARSGVHTVGLDLAPYPGGGAILLGTFEGSRASRTPGPRQAGDELWMSHLDAEGRVVRNWNLGQGADGYDLRIATSPEGAVVVYGYHADAGVLDVREVTGTRTNAVEWERLETSVPLRMELHPNYPNPFNSSTTISFAVADEGLVSLRVFNLYGALVSELTNTVLAAGNYTIAFDSEHLASGLYFCKLESKGRTLSRKMILLR